jgi:cell division protein FtsL
MHRTVNLFLLMAALASAVALYLLKYDTRRMEARVRSLERSVETLEADIARLRTEHAHLARPDRIEPMARALGLGPIGPHQYVRLRVPAEPATARPAEP